MSKFLRAFFALLLLLAAALPARAAVPVYRVGYTPTPGFFTRAQDGSYRGSGYAYLEELSLYAGCRFDYVELPLGQEFDRLRAGDVDILVGSSGTPFPDFLYSHHDIARPALELSLSDHAQRNLADTPRIAYFAKIHTEQALRASLARFFPKGNYTLVPFTSLPAMDDAAAKGEVDAITNDSFHPHPGTQPAGHLRLLASHLTYAPGNAALCAQLDRAIDEMLTVTPNLRPLLEQQAGRDRAPLFLTPEEKAYLAEHNHFTAFASPSRCPIPTLRMASTAASSTTSSRRWSATSASPSTCARRPRTPPCSPSSTTAGPTSCSTSIPTSTGRASTASISRIPTSYPAM